MLTAGPLVSERLSLEPLAPAHADELVHVLDDPALHRFTGGEPLRLDELRTRFERQAQGESPDGRDVWLNWVVRERVSGRAVGTVQATLPGREGGRVAELAWVIGTSHQGNGFAKEAALTVADWLFSQDVGLLRAHIHPEHRASMAVARAAGFEPTPVIVDGENRWSRRGPERDPGVA
jgi:RimJ/RimL family protein N-acetyltransferase